MKRAKHPFTLLKEDKEWVCKFAWKEVFRCENKTLAQVGLTSVIALYILKNKLTVKDNED